MCSLSNERHLNSDTHIAYESLSRRQLRSLVFHLLYAAESHQYQESLEAIAENMAYGYNIEIPIDSDVFKTAQAIIDHRDELDKQYVPFLHNWRFERIGLCTKLILRYAIWELFHTDTAANIAINEAVELEKCFSEKDAYKFINGILDEVIKAKESADTPSSTT